MRRSLLITGATLGCLLGSARAANAERLHGHPLSLGVDGWMLDRVAPSAGGNARLFRRADRLLQVSFTAGREQNVTPI